MFEIVRAHRGRLVVVVVVAALVAAGSAVLHLARGLRDDLAGAESASSSAASALRDGRLNAAIDDLDLARRRLEAAADRRDTRLWTLATRIPVLGGWTQLVEELSRTAETAVSLGREVTADLLRLQERGAADGVPMAAVRQLDADLNGPSMSRLEDAVRLLVDAQPRWVPGALSRARRDAVDQLGELLQQLRPAGRAASLLPALLGGDGHPRHYLLAMQNSAELRGTGGLVGFWSVLTVDDGSLHLSEPVVDESLQIPSGEVHLAPDFLDRYGHTGPAGGLVNANLDPDFPTSARVLVQVIEAATRMSLDGVIAVDPTALQILFAGEEDLQLEGWHDPAARLSDRLPVADLARVLLVDVYNVLGGTSTDRQHYQTAAARAAFDRLVRMPWDVRLIDRLASAVRGRHVQIYSTRAREEALLDELGVSGRLVAPPNSDLLAVTANNAGAVKQDTLVRHGLDIQVELAAPRAAVAEAAQGRGTLTATRTARVRVSVENPLPTTGRDPYLIATALPGVGPVPALAGHNRTWFTVWAPGRTRLEGAEDSVSGSTSASYRGLLAVDHLLDTPSMSARSFAVTLSGPVTLERHGTTLLYRLQLWHQAKGIPDDLDVTLRAPPGWRVAASEVSPADPAASPATGDQVAPVHLEAQETEVHVTGAVFGDVALEITLEPDRS